MLSAIDTNGQVLNPHVTITQSNLALLYSQQGRYQEADRIASQVLASTKQIYGPRSEPVASSLNNLAVVKEDLGDLRSAGSLYLEARAMFEATVGSKHPNVATVLNSLSRVALSRGAVDESIDFSRQAEAIEERNIKLNIFTGSVAERQAYMETLRYRLDLRLSINTTIAQDNPRALDLALTSILRRKGRALDAFASQMRTIRSKLTVEDQALIGELQDVRGRHANLAVGGNHALDIAGYQAKSREIAQREQDLEETLWRKSAPSSGSANLSLDDVQRSLPQQAVLIEIVSYTRYEDGKWGDRRYVAYGLTHRGPTGWIDLGPVSPMDRLVRQFRVTLANAGTRNYKEIGRLLDHALMEPIRRKLLSGYKRVLICPDGELSVVPFEALVDENGKYLIERFTFNYLTSGRDLLAWRNNASAKEGPVVVANPDYGEAEAGSGHDRLFEPLPATGSEGRKLAHLLHLKPDFLLEQGRATKAAVLKVASPVLLHVATHGFFFESEPPATPSQSASSYFGGNGPALAGRIDNPLLRAGLALAGANHVSPSGESGILTALEVSGLDLFGTQLVVLSACNTGVGDRTNGNGLYGLRRALVLAGSHSQVLSLWTIDDPVTLALMSEYYKRLLAGEGKAEGLAHAKMAIFRRQSHPYYWASFTFSGDDEPLKWRP